MPRFQRRLYIACLALRLFSAKSFAPSSPHCGVKRQRPTLAPGRKPSSHQQQQQQPTWLTTDLRAQSQRTSYYDNEEEEEPEEGSDAFRYYQKPSSVRATDGGQVLPRRLRQPMPFVEAPLQRRVKDPSYSIDDIYGTGYSEEDFEFAGDEEDFENDDDEHDYLDDDDELESGPAATTGNFWSNPSAAPDRPVLSRPTNVPLRRNPRQASSVRPRSHPLQQRRTTSTFRSGTPPPPAPVRDLYNKLFWYGIQDDSDQPGVMDEADATMFGGTKGKFNGLAYLQAGEAEDMDERRQQRRRTTRRQGSPGIGQERFDDRDAFYARTAVSNWWGPVTPPDDIPNPVNSDSRKRRRRNSNTSRDDWTSNTVSSWFDDRESDDYEQYMAESSPDRRERRSDASLSSPLFGALDAFLGLNRKNLQEKAEWYDNQMGIDRRPTPKLRPRTRSEYAYPLDETESRDDASLDDGVVDIDPIPVQVRGESVQSEEVNKEGDISAENSPPWQERAMAVERVPPAGIAAWGPSGELEMDARTKAILDALEDIMNAKRRLKDHERLVELAKEEVAILRVDSQLNEKRLMRARKDMKAVQSEIRALDASVQEASRKLRLSMNRLKRLKEELADLEARHWAVLSFYNPDQVAANLAAAFRELEESEPAVKLYKAAAESSEISPDANSEP